MYKGFVINKYAKVKPGFNVKVTNSGLADQQPENGTGSKRPMRLNVR